MSIAMTNKQFLHRMAEGAIEDFEQLLRIMGKESMDVDDFCNYMSTLGYAGEDASFVFYSLVGPQAAVSGGALDGDTLRELYSSPTYTACESNVQTGRDVMNFIKSIFSQVDTGNTGSLDKDDLRTFVLSMISRQQEDDNFDDDADYYDAEDEKKFSDAASSTITSNLADGIVGEILKCSGADTINVEQLSSILLRYHDIPLEGSSEIKIAGFDSSTLNPFHSSADEFATAVEEYVFGHGALNHHLLDSLSKGVYGEKTVGVVADFLEAYRFFTCRFCTYLRGTIDKMPEEHMVDILMENEEEEHGHYEVDDLEMMVALGLDPEPLKGVVHKDLYVQLLDNLKNVSKTESKSQEDLQAIAAELVKAFNAACVDEETSSAESSIAAMYFGSELLVSKLYGQICRYLKTDERLSTQDLAFFILHIDMDVEHARLMRLVVVELCNTHAQRESMIKAVSKILDARVNFYDNFVQCLFPPTGHGGTHSGALYNKQSSNWVRKTASCLSDFTGRPVVFEMCEPHIHGANVLDVGSGEGYAARKFMSMGAGAVTGLDISENMVAKARENATSENENYLVGDAGNLKAILEANPATVGIVPGAATEIGCFDLAVGIFVFNYTSIHDMNRICQQVHNMLKPGGHFVFSVPHPFMLHAHEESGDTAFGFDKGDAGQSAYFSLRDRKFSGTIKTLDGNVLNVKMCFKAISDYIEAVDAAGFNLSYIHEARVLPEHVSEHPDFFASVKDSPLHIVFKVQKKQLPKENPSALLSMPQKIRWKPYQFKSPEATLIKTLPVEAKVILEKVVSLQLSKGVTADTYELNAADKKELGPLVKFAAIIRQLVAVDTGAALVRGLDFGSEQATKLAFYILSSLVGKIDDSARGRLFDVQDSKLRFSSDNVLFSVGNSEATWHTDGASVSKAYDAVSLLCLQPASSGGEIRISNAVNAFESLQARLPKFLMFELLRSVPRDILENGDGKGQGGDILLNFCRSPNLLKYRVRNNAFPIYVDGGSSMRFRYMRYWIETGHSKAGLPMSPLLSVAMDLLDAALDESKLWDDRMQPGDAIYCNNLLTAHARNGFLNEPGDAPRHKVRTWLKL
jgi:SAM-dependent methyltransferase/pyrroloquinoline quinone (PQQ) biosynthesis protein C